MYVKICVENCCFLPYKLKFCLKIFSPTPQVNPFDLMIKVNWIFIKLKLENLCDLGGKVGNQERF